MAKVKKVNDEKELQALMEERKTLTEENKSLSSEYDRLCEEDKLAFAKFKKELENEKINDELRNAGKLIKMCKIQFHYQEEPGGTLNFTKQCIRYSFRDGEQYTVLKEVADHINTRKYPDRALVRKPGASKATLEVVGSIPRCSATIIETIEKEYDPKTDIPDQGLWGQKAQSIRV